MTSTQSSPHTHPTKGRQPLWTTSRDKTRTSFKTCYFCAQFTPKTNERSKNASALHVYHASFASIFGSRHVGFQHVQVLGYRNSPPVHAHPVLSRPCRLTAEQWPVPSVAVIEKRNCSAAVGRPSVSLSGLVSVALVGGEGRGLWRARQPPVGSC